MRVALVCPHAFDNARIVNCLLDLKVQLLGLKDRRQPVVVQLLQLVVHVLDDKQPEKILLRSLLKLEQGAGLALLLALLAACQDEV